MIFLPVNYFYAPNQSLSSILLIKCVYAKLNTGKNLRASAKRKNGVLFPKAAAVQLGVGINLE